MASVLAEESLRTFQEATRTKSPEERKQMVTDMISKLSEPLIMLFLILEMDRGIETTIENAPTGHEFKFSFLCTKKPPKVDIMANATVKGDIIAEGAGI